jgi:hypothetical protein
MGVRYEWADEDVLILKVYLETPWTWAEYHEITRLTLPIMRDSQRPCATVVNAVKIGALPKDGNVIRIMMNVVKEMPDNIFASVVVGAPYPVKVFMNAVIKVQPRGGRTAFFAETMEDAYAIVHKRHAELYPASQDQ